MIGCFVRPDAKCSIKIECQEISQSPRAKHKQCQLIKRQCFSAILQSSIKNQWGVPRFWAFDIGRQFELHLMGEYFTNGGGDEIDRWLLL